MGIWQQLRLDMQISLNLGSYARKKHLSRRISFPKMYYLLSYIIYLFHYGDFNLADIDQFSENVTNGGQRLQTYHCFKYS